MYTGVDIDQQIDQIATSVGIDPALLNQDCLVDHLMPISKLIANWELYANYLGLTQGQINFIRTAPTANLRHLEVLKEWKKKNAYSPQGHYRYLLRGCIEQGDRDIAGRICELLK